MGKPPKTQVISQSIFKNIDFLHDFLYLMFKSGPGSAGSSRFWTFEIPAERSTLGILTGHWDWLHIGNTDWTFGISTGHWEYLLDIGNIDWTLGISVERSESRSNVRNLDRTFEISIERSKSRPDVRNLGWVFRKVENVNMTLGAQNMLPELLVEARLIFWIWIFILWDQSYPSRTGKRANQGIFMFTCYMLYVIC